MIVTAPCFLQKLLCPLLNFKRVWRWRQKWNTFDWNLRPPLLVSGQMKGGGLDRLGGLDCMSRNCLHCLGGVGRNYLGWLLPPSPGLGWGSSADQGHALARYSILDLVSPSHISLVYWTYSLKQSCPQVAQHDMFRGHLAGDPVLEVPIRNIRSRFVLDGSCWVHHTVRRGGRGPPGLHQSWKGYIAGIRMWVVSVWMLVSTGWPVDSAGLAPQLVEVAWHVGGQRGHWRHSLEISYQTICEISKTFS